METIKSSYIDYVRNIVEFGENEHKGQNIREILGNYYYIPDPLGLKYVIRYDNYSADDLIADISRGVFDIDGSPIKKDALLEYVQSLDNPSSQGFVYSYPDRLCNHFGLNQLESMVERIEDNLGSNRAIAITYDPRVDSCEEHIPCLQSVQAVLRKQHLSLHAYFRSNDIYGAYYSNMFFLTYLGLKLVDWLKESVPGQVRGFAGLYYYASSGHIYNNDMRSAKRLISKNK